MVNSRCVAGSSTGTREFSAKRSTKRLTPTRLSEAPAWGHAAASGAPSMPLSERSPAASTNAMKQRTIVGSAKLAIVTSRLAPSPSKHEPVSIAARTRAKRPSASNPANATMSPADRAGRSAVTWSSRQFPVRPAPQSREAPTRSTRWESRSPPAREQIEQRRHDGGAHPQQVPRQAPPAALNVAQPRGGAAKAAPGRNQDLVQHGVDRVRGECLCGAAGAYTREGPEDV